jgi:para-aminobenzoate synthetase component I
MNSTPIAILRTANDTFLLALDCDSVFDTLQKNFFVEIDKYINQNKGSYLFTCASYDLKNDFENLNSKNTDSLNFPNLILWKPKYVVELRNNTINFLQGVENQGVKNKIETLKNKIFKEKTSLPKLKFTARTSKENYIKNVVSIQKEIQLGNTYELNYCQEFYAENVAKINPFSLFQEVLKVTNAPFSAFIEFNEFQIFSGSPERFLKKENNTLISQPIKGTIKRGKSIAEDNLLKSTLISDPKERSENIMICDLVRNDFSKLAIKNSVRVDELCGLYTFETVHHLISTVSCELKPEVTFTDILRATFPMGSMTGAPKISSMQLIEQFENFKRGIYSGSIGYIMPNGDFDLSVVIRTMVYNTQKKHLSCAVGSAITIKSEAEKEYNECLEKVQKITQIFGNDSLEGI